MNPIYIGGLDRSGKTTMRAFLASHPNISIPAVGSNMWTYFYRRYGDLADPDNLRRCLDAMTRYKHVAFLQPDRERIEREFAAGPSTYARLFSLFLAHHAEREGKPRWGAQTGLIERYADVLVASYPGVRIVHMIRDPRDRYEASLARWPEGKGRAGGATARWKYSTRLGERHFARYPDSYLLVRFEDLVLDTEATLKRVFAFVGETWDPSVLSMPGAPEYRSKLGSRGLSDEWIGRFRGRVPDHEIAFMQLHAGDLMDNHGYERVPAGTAEPWRFAVAWADQAARMVAWRGIEGLQERFPRIVRRTPGDRMLVRQEVPTS